MLRLAAGKLNVAKARNVQPTSMCKVEKNRVARFEEHHVLHQHSRVYELL